MQPNQPNLEELKHNATHNPIQTEGHETVRDLVLADISEKFETRGGDHHQLRFQEVAANKVVKMDIFTPEGPLGAGYLINTQKRTGLDYAINANSLRNGLREALGKVLKMNTIMQQKHVNKSDRGPWISKDAIDALTTATQKDPAVPEKFVEALNEYLGRANSRALS